MGIYLIVAIYIASIAAAIALTTVALNTPRLTTARVALAGFMLSTVVWSVIALVYVLEAPDDPTLAIVCVVPVVATMVAFVRVLVDALRNAAWRPSRAYLVSAAVHPVAALIVAAVPPWHRFLVVARPDGEATYEGAFWVHAALSYGFLISALVVLASARRHIPALTRRSFPLTAATWSLPVVANLFTIIYEGANGIDLTPIAFVFTAVFLGRSMVHDGLADVVPVARVEVFESLADAVIVLDTSGRVIDANTRASAILRLLDFEGRALGLRLDDISAGLSSVVATDGERDVRVKDQEFVVQVRRSSLTDRSGREVGTLIHIRDVTEEALHTRELIRVRDELASEARLNEELRAELADQVVRDVDTGLRNRRFVFETLPDLVAQCEARHEPLAVIMVDVDDFKAINDTHGHAAGDRVLSAVASAMDGAARGAIVARFGGEEFVILVPGEDHASAVALAEAIRMACAAVEIPAREGPISVTVSAGVAWSGPEDLDGMRLIERADVALYDAKNGGRDRTSVAVPDAV